MRYGNRTGFSKKRVLYILVIGLLMCMSNRTARADSDVLQQVRKSAGRIRTLQAAFVQEKRMKILVRPLISKGRFYFKSPDAIRWEYQSPVRSLFLMAGGEVRRLFEKNGKLVPDTGASLQAMQVVMQHITNWLRGRFDENPDFRIEARHDRIILIPSTSISAMIQRIELLLSRRPGIIDQIFIFEDEHNFTKITFQDLKVDQPIPESVFRPIQ